METRRIATAHALAALLALAGLTGLAAAQHLPQEHNSAAPAGPPLNAGFFPLSQVRAGMTGTAWTVFEGTAPEPMQVEILGVLRGARGPGQDMILARLHGTKPEFTGVVAGMSGSPVYIDGKLAGSLSYRIGQFSKEPIAGITPIEQMLAVRDLPVNETPAGTEALRSKKPGELGATVGAKSDAQPASGANFQPMETPLVLSGFQPEAIRFWQQQMAGTALEMVAAGGSLSGSQSKPEPETAAQAKIVPGSAVSMQLIRGDLDVSATCTVTWADAKQLLACGHAVLGAGPVSMPMTATEVVLSLASPLNAFKIVNTGAVVGAFTEDRESAIRGVFGAKAQMIPMHVAIDAPEGKRQVNVEILDQPSLTPTAAMEVLYESLLDTNQSSAAQSYHVTGSIEMAGFPAVPLDLWGPASEAQSGAMQAALTTGDRFNRFYANGTRQGAIRGIELHVEVIPRRVTVTLEQARIVSADMVHAGETIEVEATVRGWHEAERNLRIPVKLPARLAAGNLRLLVSDAATLDRTLHQPRIGAPPADMETLLAEIRGLHAADRIYVSLLAPETQAEVDGQTLAELPLSMANALEPMRNQQSAGLNGESAETVGEIPAGGVLSGYQLLTLHIDAGGGLN